MYTKANRTVVFLFVALCISACASMPDVIASYYLPKTSVSVHVVRTFACNAAKESFTTSTVTAAVTHAADLDKRQTVALRSLDGTLSDADVQLQFYEDGRLKGINSSSTGQAEAVIKPLVAIAAAAFGATHSTPDSKSSCSYSADPSKPITLTFTREIDFSDIGGKTATGAEKLTSDQVIDPDPDSKPTFDKIHDALGYMCVRIEKLTLKPDSSGKPIADLPGFESTTDASKNVELPLQQPARVALKVWSSNANTCQFKSDTNPIWTGQSEVAQLGTPYQLPIPKAVLFGKIQVSLALAESGAVTTLQYTKQAAAPSVATAAQDISAHTTPESAAQKAADLKAEGDIIAEQQRLIRCRADPAKCT
jgi:hypothetical protein